MSMTTFERVERCIRDALIVNQEHVIRPDTQLIGNLAMDSMDVTELEVDLADEFDIEFPKRTHALYWDTVQDIVSEVDALVSRRKSEEEEEDNEDRG
jgi:acyl carrier protein